MGKCLDYLFIRHLYCFNYNILTDRTTSCDESLHNCPCAHGTCASLHIGRRFKSQALLDDAALVTCMTYVDLNPICAQMTRSLETSEHTSIKKRILKAQQAEQPLHLQQQPQSLMPFVGYPQQDMPKGLAFRLNDYRELANWTGRILREDKRGTINEPTV